MFPNGCYNGVNYVETAIFDSSISIRREYDILRIMTDNHNMTDKWKVGVFTQFTQLY